MHLGHVDAPQTRGRSAGPFDRTIDVQIRRLRLKVEADNANPILIVTERGAGYRLASAVDTGRSTSLGSEAQPVSQAASISRASQRQGLLP